MSWLGYNSLLPRRNQLFFLKIAIRGVMTGAGGEKNDKICGAYRCHQGVGSSYLVFCLFWENIESTVRGFDWVQLCEPFT